MIMAGKSNTSEFEAVMWQPWQSDGQWGMGEVKKGKPTSASAGKSRAERFLCKEPKMTTPPSKRYTFRGVVLVTTTHSLHTHPSLAATHHAWAYVNDWPCSMSTVAADPEAPRSLCEIHVLKAVTCRART